MELCLKSIHAPLCALVLCTGLASRAQVGQPDTVGDSSRLLMNEAHSSLGVLVGGYRYVGGTWDTAFLANGTGGHYLFDGFTVEGQVLSLMPLKMPLKWEGFTLSSSVGVRLGYTAEHWSVLAGPVLRATGSLHSVSFQAFPSVKGLYRLGKVTWEAGVLDGNGRMPAHVGLSHGPVGLAYILPLGARAHVRIPLLPRVGLQVEGLAFRVGDARSAMLMIGVVGNPP